MCMINLVMDSKYFGSVCFIVVNYFYWVIGLKFDIMVVFLLKNVLVMVIDFCICMVLVVVLGKIKVDQVMFVLFQ